MIKVFDDSAAPEKFKELTESYSVEDAKARIFDGNKQMRTLRVADLEAKPGEKISGYVHVVGAELGNSGNTDLAEKRRNGSYFRRRA